MATSQKSTKSDYQILISLLEDFLVSRSVLPAKEKGLKTPGELCSLTLHEFFEQKGQATSFWKMSKDCFLTTVERLSQPSSPRLMSWGMTSSGKLLTAKVGFHKIVNEYSLSEILEENVDPKYFLSEKMVAGMIRRLKERGRQAFVLAQDPKDTTRPLKRISLTHLQPDQTSLAEPKDENTKT